MILVHYFDLLNQSKFLVGHFYIFELQILNFLFLNLQHIVYQLFDRDFWGTFKDLYLLRPITPPHQPLLSMSNRVILLLIFVYLHSKFRIPILKIIILFVEL